MILRAVTNFLEKKIGLPLANMVNWQGDYFFHNLCLRFEGAHLGVQDM